MQMDLGVAGFQRAKEIFVIADLQVGMKATLKENAGAAEFEHLIDFLVDGFKREDVAILCAEGTIERAEGAVFGTEVGVIDVAIDLVGGHARVIFLQAQLIRGHANADQIIGLEHFEGFLFGDGHVSFPLAAKSIALLER
jgi:hypothetical protein